MATFGKVTESEATPVADYILELKTVTEEDSQFDNGSYRKWVFVCKGVHSADDPDDAERMVGEEIWGATTMSLAKASRGYAWTCALLRREPETGEEIEENDLYHRPVIGSVLPYTKKDKTVTTRLERLRPYKKPGGAKAKPVVEEEDDSEDLEFD